MLRTSRLFLSLLVAATLSLASACDHSDDEPNEPIDIVIEESSLLGEYAWVSSTFGTGGGDETNTPASTGTTQGLVITPDSLIYSLNGSRSRADAYEPSLMATPDWFDGVVLDRVTIRPDSMGGEFRATIGLSLKQDTLTEILINPICTEGCSTVYKRVEN